MRNAIMASTVLALFTVAPVAWADDSGHAGPLSLKAEQSLHDGSLGRTTESHTAEDAITTPGARHALRQRPAVQTPETKNQ